MSRTLTITLSDAVYERLQDRVGSEHIDRFIENLVRPHVLTDSDLEAAYREMAADADRERDALEWIEAAPDEALE